MNPTDPLDQLRDIHLPEAISWWPPAPGWWLLATAFLLLIIFLAWWGKQQRLASLYRRQALQELHAIATAKTTTKTTTKTTANKTTVESVGKVLRRTAKTAYPEHHWEALPTTTMLQMLNNCCKEQVFSGDLINQLGQALYRPDNLPDNVTKTFSQTATQWIKQHQRTLPKPGSEASC